ncbi:MAG: ABC transporter substrate-binding protein [Tannerellaceae bacterium]|nr:ABC transporter substrate-binding protein [Tannerellaceae bacterium]
MRNRYFSIFIGILLVQLFSGCRPDGKKENQAAASLTEGQDYSIRYAQGFKVSEFPSYKLVDIQDPAGESDVVYQYALLDRGHPASGIPQKYEIIEVPVRKVICMTSLQLFNFIKLNELDKVVGITSTRFLLNSQINEQLRQGTTSKIGIEGNFDSEVILALAPDIILVSPFKRGGYETIRNLDIPLISFLGYKETSPLGQAEWIRFTAMLLGIEEKANRQFEEIEEKYNALKALAASAEHRPSVLSGEMHSGNWYVVGGNSYLAQLFRDAGGEYFRRNDESSGGFYVDFETVYSEAAEVDYWRVANSFNGEFSYEALRQSDDRYADFKAFRDKQVIYCNLRQTPFYEQTPVEPEVVLADLIRIFHPDLLPDHTPVYYDLLK